jgi:hypothetical protein
VDSYHYYFRNGGKKLWNGNGNGTVPNGMGMGAKSAVRNLLCILNFGFGKKIIKI